MQSPIGTGGQKGSIGPVGSIGLIGLIGLIGPSPDRPCGIADYVRRLEASLRDLLAREGGGSGERLVLSDFPRALADPALDRCAALLVHYERSLVDDPGFLRSLASRHPGKVFVVPHEVYGEDPFAYPYAALRSPFPPLLWLKRLRYRWRHRGYAREKALQREGYFAHRVLPLSLEGREILLAAAGDPAIASRILAPVPLARHDAGTGGGAAAEAGMPAGGDGGCPRPSPAGAAAKVFGIFGFLNPGLDYGSAFDLLERLGAGAELRLLGGDRGGGSLKEGLERDIASRGLGSRVRITGYLPEEDLPGHLVLCDAFLCPMRFKSNSGSLLRLFWTGKPILVPDVPLTRFLRDEGAPIHLYDGPEDLLALGRGVMDGALRPPEDRYAWDFPAVAEAYLRAMRTERRAQ
jgi:glycosyltransferase involved in cell wall biosynthesis